jgi:hypothetical protein
MSEGQTMTGNGEVGDDVRELEQLAKELKPWASYQPSAISFLVLLLKADR